MIRATEQQRQMLAQVNSSFALCVNDGVDTVYIGDKTSGKRWHSATGTDMQDAFNNAVATMLNSSAPKTPVQTIKDVLSIEAENAQLKEQIASLKLMSEKAAKKHTLKDE
mgnify:CR=1 FL=1|tara:strand:- start:2842 stop:3171 length:330 start_codon:yes stop_codon:yes gene_type:complete